MLRELQAYAGSPEATAEGVAERCNKLSEDEWDVILAHTSTAVPLPKDGRADLNLGDGGQGWGVLWWDKDGRRVVGHYDYAEESWFATPDGDINYSRAILFRSPAD